MFVYTGLPSSPPSFSSFPPSLLSRHRHSLGTHTLTQQTATHTSTSTRHPPITLPQKWKTGGTGSKQTINSINVNGKKSLRWLGAFFLAHLCSFSSSSSLSSSLSSFSLSLSLSLSLSQSIIPLLSSPSISFSLAHTKKHVPACLS